jgi:signal transduction histidine kinase
MDRAKRFRAYLLPLGLLVLLGILASLQYRWTGQISAAERERMQASLRSSTFRFSRDVNEEVVALFRTFHLDSARDIDANLALRLDRWRAESAFPELVKDIYVFRPREGAPELFELGNDGLRPTPWPDDLSKWRERAEIVEDRGERAGRRRPPLPVLSDDPPCLGVPIGSPRDGWAEATQPGQVLVLLDETVLREKVLPELEARYFGPEFDVVIVNRYGKVVFASSEVEPSTLMASADAEAPLLSPRGFFGEGLPRERRALPPRRAGSPGRGRIPGIARAPFGGAGRPSEGGWSLFVRHRAGSLDAAVAAARSRNLAVSFAVMGLLAASVVLVSVSARRATELSERQMEFVAGVSHELRTPVAVIRSAGQNLADGSVSDPSRVAHYGHVIEAEGRRLESLVEQVLALAGIQSQKRRYQSVPVPVQEIVSRAVSDGQSLAPDDSAEVAVRYNEPDLRVQGDREALRQVVANLVGNAIKHGGKADGVEVQISRRPEHRVAIRVVDRGPGIPNHEREHLFEAFFRGSRAQQRQIAGSGLGLSLVDHIVREHGGTIEVESSPGKGASFTIVLPEAEQPA